jgi:head-tail adaptor
LRSGQVHVSAAQLDLEKTIGDVAKREAQKHGITIEETRVAFRARGARSISADARFTAKKLLFRAKIDISGQMQIDESFRVKLSNLKCRGDGKLGSIACGVLEPHLRKLEGRSFSLMSLPLGEIRLRDVRIAVADTVDITADFGSAS